MAPTARHGRRLEGSLARGGARLKPTAELRFTRIDPEAKAPVKAHTDDAAFDLFAAEDVLIPPGARATIRTGISVAIPPGNAGLVLPRSGRAIREGLTLVNSPGLIDPGYRGEVKVLALNTDRASEIELARADRVAQLLIVPFAALDVVEVEALDETERGTGGLGSTGA